MKISFLASFILFLSSQTSFALTIGKVTDKQAISAIAGVKISISKGDSIEPAYSDSHGLFNINAKVGEELLFEKPGYTSKSITVTPSRIIYAQLQIEFIDTVAPLDTLLSTAGRTEQKISQIPASVVVVTKHQISTFGYTNVEEILRNVPGLYAIEEYDWTGGGSNIGVRGFLTGGFNNAMMIMINGVNQYEDYWGFYPLSRMNVPVETIERIEIVRGPMSVVYGSGALMGAINIITRTNNESTQNSSVSLTSMSNGIQKISTKLVSDSIFNQTIIASFEQGDEVDFDLKSLDYEDGTQIRAQDALHYSKLYLGISGSYKNNLTFNANITRANKGTLASFSKVQSQRQYADMQGFNFHIGYQNFQFDKAVRLKSGVSYYTHASAQNYSSGHSLYGFTSYSSSAYQIEFDTFIDGRLLWNLPFNTSFGYMQRTTFDLQNAFDLALPTFSDRYIQLYPNDKVLLRSIHGQIDFQWTEQLLLISGVRIEKGNSYRVIYGYKTPGDAQTIQLPTCPELSETSEPFEQCGRYKSPNLTYTPRLALLYSLNPNNVVKLIYGKGLRQPSFGQISDVVIDGESLAHEQLDAIELVYLNQYSRENTSLALNSQLSLFNNRLNSLIFRSAGGKTTNNTLSGKTQGVEFSLELTSRNTESMLAFSYQDSSSISISNPPISPSWLGYFRISQQLTKNLSLGLSIRYIDKMYNDLKCNIDSICSHINNTSAFAKSTWLMNGQINYKNWFDFPVDIQFSIKNIFDTHYRYPITLNNSTLTQGFPGNGRRFQLSLNTRF